MTKRILIFGGAFNPPTLAHQAIVAACLALPQFDQVWIIPSGDRFDKQIIDATDADRLHMLRNMHSTTFNNDPRLLISDFELRLPRPSATHQTVAALQREYPDAEFTFVFGRDSYATMPVWPHGPKLQSTLDMLIITSGPGNAISADNVHILPISGTHQNASSTEVRKRIASGQGFDDLVAPVVARFITDHHLYKTRA